MSFFVGQPCRAEGIWYLPSPRQIADLESRLSALNCNSPLPPSPCLGPSRPVPRSSLPTPYSLFPMLPPGAWLFSVLADARSAARAGSRARQQWWALRHYSILRRRSSILVISLIAGLKSQYLFGSENSRRSQLGIFRPVAHLQVRARRSLLHRWRTASAGTSRRQ